MKFLTVFLLFILSFASVSAQMRNFEIEVFLKETIFNAGSGSKEIPVRVTIKNNAEEVLKTDGLNYLHFYFSKCPIEISCRRYNYIYMADSPIPQKRIRENESFEFEINLVRLYWKTPKNMKSDTGYKQKRKDEFGNFEMIPDENIYFYAGIKLLRGWKEHKVGDEITHIPVYRAINSNVIGVTFK